MKQQEVERSYAAFGNPFVAKGMARLGAGLVVAAAGATLTLEDEREVIDLASAGFGYGHPKLVERVRQQVSCMPLSSRMFYSRPLAQLAQRLSDLLPGALQVCFFGNAGTEAVEGALKLVKGFHRGRQKLVSALGAYHGASTGALAVSGLPPLRSALNAPVRRPFDLHCVAYGNVEATLAAIDDRTAAVLLEPTLTGQRVQVPPRGYLAAVRRRCDEVGALLVLDEVTTGLGRTGRRWGMEHDGIVPDVVAVGGALGGGMLPIGCYVATKPLNDRVYDKRDPLLHANTTGGNPSACVAALAALEVMDDEGLPARAAEHGSLISHCLRQLKARFPELVSAVACQGLLAGLQLNDLEQARTLQRAALQRGALLRLDGATSGEPWLGIRPPLLASSRELERGLAALESAFETLKQRPQVVLQEALS
jgi:putrescine aminotransferase